MAVVRMVDAVGVTLMVVKLGDSKHEQAATCEALGWRVNLLKRAD